MKKSWKIFWVIMSLFVGIGLLLVVTGVALGAGAYGREVLKDYQNAWVGGTDGTNMEILEGDTLEVDVTRGRVIVKTEDVDQLEIRTRKGVVSTTKKNNNIQVSAEGLTWIENSVLEIIVPKNLEFKELDIEISAGEVIISKLNVDKLEITLEAGRVETTDIKANEITLECSVGEIDYSGIGNLEEYSYKIDCGVGEVKFGEHQYSGIGHEVEYNANKGKSIEIECAMGKVQVEMKEQ